MKGIGKKGASMVVAVALMAMLTAGLMSASAQMPLTIKGNVTYMNNGTRVPAGWTVNISDLTKGWSISTTTEDTPPVVDFNYKAEKPIDYEVSAGDIFEVYAEDPTGTFYGSTSHTITQSEIDAGLVRIDVSVKEKIAPTTNVTAPPTLWPGKPNETTIPSGTILPWTNEAVKLWFFRTDNGGSGVAYTNLSLAAESETDTLNVTISNNSCAMDRTLKKGENVTVPFNEIFGEYFNVTISEECNATIEYYSVDNAGNFKTKTVTVRIKYPTTGNVSINEIMYAPNEEWGGQYNEWIELYNKDDKTINLAGWEIDGKEIPDGTIIKPQGYLIIARNDTSFAEIYPGVVCSVVKVSIELNNDGEELFLKDSAGNVVDSVNYTSYANKKLGKKNGKTLERNETAWEESIRNGGTPCQRNSVLPPTSFVINGYVFYEDNTACNNPAVKITNDKIGEWFAENSTDSNYYMLTLKSTAEVMAGDTLRIDASSPDGTQINVTTFVVTQADIDEGSVQINITLEQPKLNEIKVTPQSAVVTVNTTKEFIATAYDQYGNPLEGVFIYWTSTNKTVGNMSPALPNYVVTGSDGNATATFTARAPGNTTVVAVNQTDAGWIIGLANVTVISAAEYGVDLSVDEEAKSTVEGVNATYILTVKNTGNVADSYTLIVDNPDNATTAVLSGNVTRIDTYMYKTVDIASGESVIVLLNVTNETAGTFRVNVTANSTGDPSKSDYVNTTTTVEEIKYGVNLTVDEPEKKTVEGVNATYILTVKNTGNVADNYTLVVENPDNATVAELNVSSTPVLEPGEEFTVLLNVTNETAGTFRVNVTATSVGNTSVFDYVNTTTTVEKIKYGVNLIAPANKTTLVNVNATYKIVVNNTGNVRDTFNLSVNNLENAAVANLSTYQVTLDAGANTTVLLNVTDETPGTYNVSVYAESVNDTEANDTITIMTTVQAISYGVNLTVDAAAKSTVEGVNATYILTVKNTGNVADNYTLVVENPDNATIAALSGNVTPIGDYTYKTVDIEGGESVIVLLNVTNETAGTFRVNVTANSTGDPSKTDYINTTTTVSVPVYGVNLTVEGAKTAAKTTTPNVNATYILTVKNTGNVADNYMLSITYNETTAWLNRTSITNLAPGATQDVLLNVSSLTPGIFVVNVTVNSTTDPNSTDTISTATIVLPINITAFAVDSTAKRGQTLNANVTIRNEGSSTINVTVVVSGLQNETGYPIVGTGVLVNLGAGQEMTLPVRVYVPATADIGNYTLFADAWLYEDYPDVTKAIGRGPEVTSVTS